MSAYYPLDSAQAKLQRLGKHSNETLAVTVRERGARSQRLVSNFLQTDCSKP